MSQTGVLKKMRTEIGTPIQYFLNLEGEDILVNDLLDKEIKLSFKGYECLNCASKRKKIYRMGHCYDCFYEIPQTADWVIRPELSKAHLDIEDRDLEYEKSVQLKPHIVYLALSSDIKVGVTRKAQVPTRWIDQGANAAIPLVEVPNRYLAGITEIALKDFVTDKTNWRKMLKNEVSTDSLEEMKAKLLNEIPEEVKEFITEDQVLELDFPVLRYPDKVKSLNLTKTPEYTGVLKGVKGQYFIFEDNTVFNVRSNEGFVVELES